MSTYDAKFARGDRDYASLAINFHRMHGEPMPVALQIDIIRLRAERSVR